MFAISSYRFAARLGRVKPLRRAGELGHGKKMPCII
jgi:hypothetical protein